MAEEDEQPQEVLTEDEFLQELMGMWEQGTAVSGPLPEDIIGGFFGGTLNANATTPQNVTSTSVRGGATVYLNGMETEVVASMNTEQLARFQDALIATGLVRDVIPGRIDNGTINGMATLMALGNRQAVKWTEVLDGILASGQTASKTIDVPPYRPPDYATIAQEVKQTFRSKLGRDPTQAEFSMLASELQGGYRSQWEAQVEAITATETGAGRDVVVPQVSPVDRMLETFETKFGGELRQAEVEDNTRESALGTQAQLGQVGRLTGA